MLSFAYNYTRWHYTQAVRRLVIHIRNLLAFLWQYFSIPHLLVTLFSPWARLHENYASGLHLKQQAGTFVVNTLMRLVGAVVRLAVTVIGLVVLAASVLLALVSVAVWLLLPGVVVFVGMVAARQLSLML